MARRTTAPAPQAVIPPPVSGTGRPPGAVRRLPPRPPEPSAWPVYSTADWVWGGVSAAGAVLLALVLLHRGRLPAVCRHVSFRLVRLPVAFLHGIHTGVVGDYAAWLAAGAALCAVVWGATLR